MSQSFVHPCWDFSRRTCASLMGKFFQSGYNVIITTIPQERGLIHPLSLPLRMCPRGRLAGMSQTPYPTGGVVIISHYSHQTHHTHSLSLTDSTPQPKWNQNQHYSGGGVLPDWPPPSQRPPINILIAAAVFFVISLASSNHFLTSFLDIAPALTHSLNKPISRSLAGGGCTPMDWGNTYQQLPWQSPCCVEGPCDCHLGISCRKVRSIGTIGDMHR